ncbi:MAG TPA: MurR/RpiR family transcriptional regulator [Acidimicrobiia bacterium]|nr:MurR/RpiR family transcriptional regulator [Acidimicrobiia bacterium]
MAIAPRISEAADVLTPSERRLADVVLDDPQAVAFGTVATLAARAGTSGPTVVRFATKLGYQGFADLQSDAQREIADALRPATTRIRDRPAGAVVARVLEADLENVRTTLAAIEPDAFDDAIALLSDRRRRVFVLAGEIARGVGIVLVTQLDLLRDGVVALGGTPVRIARQLADVAEGDVVIAIEHRRYERWLLDALEQARAAGAEVIALTDRALSPVAEDARQRFVVAAEGVGPFDSHTASLALVNALGAGVAAKLRKTATQRLDQIETSWSDALSP